ncbi:hypothetical protein AcW1_002042 [Taiwanofungus camphoratus]|nr:hypothetical protein AcW1_002042 [Antrodia cinnamomea]
MSSLYYWFWPSRNTSTEKKSKPAPSTSPQAENVTAAIVSKFDAGAASLPPHLLALSTFILGSAIGISVVCVYGRFFKRIPNAEWVTPDMLAKKRWIKGYVTSVGDPDNFRVYHTPAFGWRWPLKFRRIPSANRDLKDQTIHIRIAGVDAPEAAHFGRPAQAFAQESLAWLKEQVEGKTVYCQLLRKDQWGRIVAFPYMKPRLFPGFLATGKSLPLEMLRRGWAQTYEQAGAEYGPWDKADFLRIQGEAQAARRGIWKYGTDGESPADYKRRYAAADTKGVVAKSVIDQSKATRVSKPRPFRFLRWGW